MAPAWAGRALSDLVVAEIEKPSEVKTLKEYSTMLKIFIDNEGNRAKLGTGSSGIFATLTGAKEVVEMAPTQARTPPAATRTPPATKDPLAAKRAGQADPGTPKARMERTTSTSVPVPSGTTGLQRPVRRSVMRSVERLTGTTRQEKNDAPESRKNSPTKSGKTCAKSSRIRAGFAKVILVKKDGRGFPRQYRLGETTSQKRHLV
jgi:hypothetical protein